MKITLKEIPVRDLVQDYQDQAENGVTGYGRKLDIRPPYQREFIYKDKQREAVIDTVTKNFPLNVMYWAVRADRGFEVIDGQQRTISICQYVKGEFSFDMLYFHNLPADRQEQILNYKLMVYFCEGTDSEKLEWFKTINIAGEELTEQELRNAVYHGSWVYDAKRYFSKTGCPAYGLASNYLAGSAIRQDYLETAIDWLSNGNIDVYMANHQHDPNASELWLWDDFDSSEIKINVDDGGKVLNIEKRHQGVGENLIEDFMLMANEVVATYIYNLELPSIYRVHDYPNEERLIKVCNVIKTYGEDFDSKISIRNPKVIQKLLKQLKPCKNFDIYSNMILRCMAKACYKTVNEGHFGIGIDYHKNEAYTHFTSPIRRYPDTSVHRVLKDILDGNCKDMTSDSYKNNLLDIANHSSQMEKVADNCERSADKMKMASYIKPFVGKSFNGRITGFTYNAMFVVLENLVEGRLDFKEMDDYYNYNEDLEVVVGERKKKVFRLGDSIKVKVIKADEKEKIIDFAEDKGGKNHGNFKQKGKVFLFRRRGN